MTVGTIAHTWRTSDYFLASFLIASGGFRVVGIDDSSAPRKTFLLADHNPALRERLTMQYRLCTDDSVPAHLLFEAQKILQRLLRDSSL